MIVYRKPNSTELNEIMTLVTLVDGDSREIDIDQFFVAIDNETIVGCVRIKHLPDESQELASMAVLPEYRKQGIGSTLINTILQNTSDSVYLLCSPKNEHFYTSNGFVTITPQALSSSMQKEYNRIAEKLAGTNLKIVAMVTSRAASKH